MKKLLIFRFENVLIKIDPGKYYIQKNVWLLLDELKSKGYELAITTSIDTGNFLKAATSSAEVSYGLDHYFSMIIKSHQPDNQLDEILLFAKKNNIKKEEIVYFGYYFSDWEAAKNQSINFIGILNDSSENLLAKRLPEDEATYPALLAEFLQNYLELTTTV